MHTVTWGTMEPTERGDAGLPARGTGAREERKEEQQEGSLASGGFSLHQAPCFTQHSFLCQNLLAAHCPEPRRRREASWPRTAISARVSQEQAAATVRSPESGKKCSLPPHTCPLFHDHRFIICIIFIPSFWAPPAFPCETSSEMPLLELITLSWQLEFSKFNSPAHLPSTNSPFPIPISCHIYVFLKKQKTWEKIRPTSPPGKCFVTCSLFQHSTSLLGI